MLFGVSGPYGARLQKRAPRDVVHQPMEKRYLMKALSIIASMFILMAAAACGSKPKAEPEKPTSENIQVTAEPEPPPEPEPEVAAEPEPPPAPATSLHDVIYFEFDSAVLSDESRAALNENATWLQEDPTRTLTIEGHTDEVGTSEYNLALGQRRAQAAKEYLVRLGIAADRVEIITFGEERPASSVDSENRRSVFVATKK